MALLDDRFLSRVVAGPRGRAFLYNFMTDAEEADEQGVFDHLLRRVDDPDLHKLVRIHRDDETRHAAMMRACLERTGVTPEKLTDETRIVPLIDKHSGNVAEAFVNDRSTVMDAYLMLQVIEERAVFQFPHIAAALKPVDPDASETVSRIARDEARHVKYAKAVAKRYAPSEQARERALLRYRRAEAMAFAEHQQILLRYVLDRDLLQASRAEKLFWRGLSALDGVRPVAPSFTPFAQA